MIKNSIKLYHLSYKSKRESILQNGLIPMAYNGNVIKYEPRIFVSNSKKNLAFDYVGFDNVDVWEIKTDQILFNDPFSSCVGHFYLKNHIPKENLKLIKCY